MPLPLTVSCFSKIQIGFTFLVPAHLGSPGKRAVKRVCVCVYVLITCRFLLKNVKYHDFVDIENSLWLCSHVCEYIVLIDMQRLQFRFCIAAGSVASCCQMFRRQTVCHRHVVSRIHKVHGLFSAALHRVL